MLKAPTMKEAHRREEVKTRVMHLAQDVGSWHGRFTTVEILEGELERMREALKLLNGDVADVMCYMIEGRERHIRALREREVA